MKNKYFTVCEVGSSNDEYSHVGTLVASNDIELREKLSKAVASHFDVDNEHRMRFVTDFALIFDSPYPHDLSIVIVDDKEAPVNLIDGKSYIRLDIRPTYIF